MIATQAHSAIANEQYGQRRRCDTPTSAEAYVSASAIIPRWHREKGGNSSSSNNNNNYYGRTIAKPQTGDRSSRIHVVITAWFQIQCTISQRVVRAVSIRRR
jgi:hypothetical protein